MLNSPRLPRFDRVQDKSASTTALETQTSNSPLNGEVQSHFDAFYDGAIMGWIWDPTTPKQSVSVQLHLGDEPILVQSANLYRQDLQAAGMNEGRCAFHIDVPTKVLEQARQLNKRLTVRVERRPDIVICAVDMEERLSADQRLRTLLGNMLVQSRESMAQTRLAFSGGQEENFDEPRRPAYLALLAWPDSEGPLQRDCPLIVNTCAAAISSKTNFHLRCSAPIMIISIDGISKNMERHAGQSVRL